MFTLSTDTLARSYELLRSTEPFSKWNLPPADEITFVVTSNTFNYGKCRTSWTPKQFKETLRFKIEVSETLVHTLDRLLRCMAHEMIHVSEGVAASCGTEHLRQARHSQKFFRMEAQVARAHKWEFPLL